MCVKPRCPSPLPPPSSPGGLDITPLALLDGCKKYILKHRFSSIDIAATLSWVLPVAWFVAGTITLDMGIVDNPAQVLNLPVPSPRCGSPSGSDVDAHIEDFDDHHLSNGMDVRICCPVDHLLYN